LPRTPTSGTAAAPNVYRLYGTRHCVGASPAIQLKARTVIAGQAADMNSRFDPTKLRSQVTDTRIRPALSASNRLARLPPCVVLTRSSSGVSWGRATFANLAAGARISSLSSTSRQAPSTARVVSSLQIAQRASSDYLICMVAQLDSPDNQPNKDYLANPSAASGALDKTKQTASNLLAAAAAAVANQQAQQNAAKQNQMNILVAAIGALSALLQHELMILDFAGALVIALILVDLNAQLARLL
jgi:hypothetical protein